MLRRVSSTRVPCFLTGAGVQARHTTILTVRKGDKVVLIGDRQVTLGERIVAKGSACKLRKINDNIVVGFAGSTADAFALMEKLENKLNDFPDQLTRAAVELAKDWRTDRALRRLEASLIVCNKDETLEIDGQGNVITPEEDGIVAIGSGGTYAKAAARALIDIEGYDAEKIARKAMKIATDIDVFSNSNWDVEILTREVDTSAAKAGESSEAAATGIKDERNPDEKAADAKRKQAEEEAKKPSENKEEGEAKKTGGEEKKNK